MAIYHLHAQTIGRGAGKSAVAAAAYRSTSHLIDQETGITCDYTRKSKALGSGILAPLDAPEWVRDRGQLWNEVQKKENRKNSQFAWEYDIALPKEVKHWGMINWFCQENFVKNGLICDYAMHKPDKKGDNRNYHVHIMVTTRAMTADGWGEKHRVGENKMSDRINWLKEIRKSWENICNRELERIGSKERVSCETLKEQGIDRIPQQHQGKTATAIERKGIRPERTRVKEADSEEKKRVYDLKAVNLEEKRLEEKLRIAKLSDTGIKKELEILKYAQYKANYLEIKKLLPEIEKANREEEEQNKRQIAELNRKEPNPIAQKPNAIKSFFLEWHSDDGKISKKYEDYEKLQKRYIAEWKEHAQTIYSREKEILSEKALIQEIKNSGDKPTVEILKLAVNLGERQKKRTGIFSDLTEGVSETLNKAPEFSSYRFFKQTLSEVQEAKAETVRQKQQLPKQNRERHW